VLKNATAIEKQINEATDAALKTNLLDELAGRVVMPYVVIALVLALLAMMIRRSALPEIDTSTESSAEGATSSLAAGRTSVWQFPHLVLGAVAIFMYVGAEVMAGDVIGVYGKSLGFSLDQTKYFTTFTLGAMLLGYVLSIVLIPKFISQQNFLKYSAILGIVLTVLTYLTSGSGAVTSIALLGLANAVMWPAIFPLAINGLGRFTQIGSAILVMGIAGGALIPQLYGLLDKSLGHQSAFLICMLPCYLYILYYATWGHKPR
jgi:glucose/galactose transporter